MSDTPVNTPAKQQPRQWLLGLIILILLALVLWWFWPTPSAPQTGGRWRDGGPVPVRVASAEQGDFRVQLKALGTVTAYNTVHVRSRVDGELVKLLFSEGQQVEAGQLLAQVDPRAYRISLQQVEGALQQQQAQLNGAERDLARYRGLHAEQSIAKQTLDTQEALVNQLRGGLKSLQAQVANARLNLDHTDIRAPIAGRLGLRQADVGNLLGSGDSNPLVVITQTQPITIMFSLPEAELPVLIEQVRTGAALVVEAWDRSEQRLLASGELESLDNQIDIATGTVKLKARFENSDELLFPNQFVNIRLQLQTLQQVTLIPAAALQFGPTGSFVYRLDEEDKVHLQPVQVAASDGAQTVIGSGLQPGQRVVLEGTDRLRSGNQVEVISDPAATADQAQKQPTP
jgi:membrane fusion protein, multidrug efflux system